MTDYDTSKEIEKRSKEKRRGKFQIMIVADAEIVAKCTKGIYQKKIFFVG